MALGDIEHHLVLALLFLHQVVEVGGEPSGDFLEGEVFDLGGEAAQPHGEHGQHVEGQRGVCGDQTHEFSAGEKKDFRLSQGFGVGRKGIAVEDRDLAEGFARPENMENLFLAVKGHLEDFYLAARHHVKTDARIAFEKYCLTLGVAFTCAYFIDLPELFCRKPAEQEAVGQEFVFFLHTVNKS